MALSVSVIVSTCLILLSFLCSEGARCEVVRFFQRYDTKETNCEKRDNQGWLLLKSLLLLTADSSVSQKAVVEGFLHFMAVMATYSMSS